MNRACLAAPRYFGTAPEPPVDPQACLADTARAFYARLAPPPAGSELVDQLVHTIDAAERNAITIRLARGTI